MNAMNKVACNQHHACLRIAGQALMPEIPDAQAKHQGVVCAIQVHAVPRIWNVGPSCGWTLAGSPRGSRCKQCLADSTNMNVEFRQPVNKTVG